MRCASASRCEYCTTTENEALWSLELSRSFEPSKGRFDQSGCTSDAATAMSPPASGSRSYGGCALSLVVRGQHNAKLRNAPLGSRGSGRKCFHPSETSGSLMSCLHGDAALMVSDGETMIQAGRCILRPQNGGLTSAPLAVLIPKPPAYPTAGVQ